MGGPGCHVWLGSLRLRPPRVAVGPSLSSECFLIKKMGARRLGAHLIQPGETLY